MLFWQCALQICIGTKVYAMVMDNNYCCCCCT